MRWIKDAVGELRRLWYEAGEIEQLVRDQVVLFTGPEPVTTLDLEAFAEQHCAVRLDQYAELPESTLGVTVFEPTGKCTILINGALTEAAHAEVRSLGATGRWRATLAHEIGHVLLHRVLYSHLEGQASLFSQPHQLEIAPEMRCMRSDIAGTSHAHWREVQANTAMAALLMPSASFSEAFASYAEIVRLQPRGFDRLVTHLATELLVSREAVLIRISELGLTDKACRLV